MPSSYRSHYSSKSETNLSWSRALFFSGMAFSLSLVFEANLQVVALVSGVTFEFMALIIGLVSLGIGALLGHKFKSLNAEKITIAGAVLVLIQALGFYFLNGSGIHEGLVNSQLLSGSPESRFLLSAAPLFVVGSLIGALVGNRLQGFSVSASPLTVSDSPLTIKEFPLALIFGIGLGVFLFSFEITSLGIPVLLLTAAGTLFGVSGLASDVSRSSKLRITWLAFSGVLALSVIAQVVLVREERQTLENVFADSSGFLSKKSSAKVLWTYSGRRLAEAMPVFESSVAFDGVSPVLSTLFEDSVSILVVDGVSKQLREITESRCVDITVINESPLSTGRTRTIFTLKPLALRFKHPENYYFQAVTSTAFDYITNSDRRWDMILLKNIASDEDILNADLLQPIIQESEEYFGACLRHLSDSGFIVFDVGPTTNSLALYGRLTSISSALQSRGIATPASCFTSLSVSSEKSVLLISNNPFASSRVTSKSLSLEYLACFHPGIEMALSDRHGVDLTHLTLERPYSGLLRPQELALAQPVYATSLSGVPQNEVAALYDVLAEPIAMLVERSKRAWILTLVSLGLVLAFAVVLGRRALNQTVRDTRVRERRAFFLSAIWLTGFLVIVNSIFTAESLRLGSQLVPEQIRIVLFIGMFGLGLWLSARKRRSMAKEHQMALTFALVLSLMPTALLGLSSSSPVSDETLSIVVALLPFIISPALFGVLAERYIRKQKVFAYVNSVSLIAAFLFIAIGALIISRMFAATFGLAATLEFGLVILGVTGTLQILFSVFSRFFVNPTKKVWVGR